MPALKEFKLYIQNQDISDTDVPELVYFVSSVGLVSQLLHGLDLEEKTRLEFITPLSLLKIPTGKSEIEIYTEFIKSVKDTQQVDYDYMNKERKTSMVLTFKEKNLAAMFIKFIADNLVVKYKYKPSQGLL